MIFPKEGDEMKKIGSLLFYGLLAASCYFGYLVYLTPQQIYPLPYKFEGLTFEGKEKAENSQILILGDRLGEGLGRFMDPLIQETSKNLTSPLKVFNWATGHEGIHRTIEKLESLEKLPEVIIYYGGSEEFYEQRFYLKEKQNIFENIKRFGNEKLISLILTFPILSRFIYKSTKLIPLTNEIASNQADYPSKFKQKQMEVTYKIYELELDKLITYIKERDSNLILITPPINLEIAPKLVCENSQTNKIRFEQNEIKKLMKAKRFKEAYARSRKLSAVTLGNAQTFYLLGKNAMRLGKFSIAREAFYMATAFDCETWRGNAVINNIMRSQISQLGVTHVDFDKLLNNQLGMNVLFLDEIFPQHYFYEKLVIGLTGEVKRILKL